jgi:uncharacterized protein (UPF0335 family)
LYLQDPQLPFPPFSRLEYPMRGEGISRRNAGRQRGFRWAGSDHGEVALNQQVKNLIQKLGEAIHESVSESEQISGVVQEIRRQGFDVLLMLEATIGLNEVNDAEDDAEEAAAGEDSEATGGPFTRNDLSFLKSLRITTEEHDADGGTVEPDA